MIPAHQTESFSNDRDQVGFGDGLAPRTRFLGLRELNPLVLLFRQEVTDVPAHLSFDVENLPFFRIPVKLFYGVSQIKDATPVRLPYLGVPSASRLLRVDRVPPVVHLEQGDRLDRRVAAPLPDVPPLNRLEIEEHQCAASGDLHGMPFGELITPPALVPAFYELTANGTWTLRVQCIEPPCDVGVPSVCLALLSRFSQMVESSLCHPYLPVLVVVAGAGFEPATSGI